MKNILAENLLRFGVKNLSESDKGIVLSKSLLKELKDPVKTETATKGTGTKEDPKQMIERYICTYQGFNSGKETTCEVRVAVTTKDLTGKTGWVPGIISFMAGSFQNPAVRYGLTLDGTVWKRSAQSSTAFNEFYYTGPGNIPINAVKAVIAALNTKLKTNYSLDPTTENEINTMPNKYFINGPVVNGQYPFESTAKLQKSEQRNPETDQAIRKYIATQEAVEGGLSIGTGWRVSLPVTGPETITGDTIMIYNGNKKTLSEIAASMSQSMINGMAGYNNAGNGKSKQEILSSMIQLFAKVAGAAAPKQTATTPTTKPQPQKKQPAPPAQGQPQQADTTD